MRVVYRAFTRVAAAVGLVALLYVLGLVRRAPEAIEDAWRAGNVLRTHDYSGVTADRVYRSLAALQLGAIAGLVCLLAQRARRRELTAGLGIAVAFVAVFVDSATRYATTIGGRLYVMVTDDAYISMRFARNIASGLGPIFNRGERVEGFTNPLWTLLMVVPHVLGVHEGVTTVPMIALAGAMLMGTAAMAWAIMRRHGMGLPSRVLVVLVLLFDSSTFDFALSGLETPLVMLAATAVVYGCTQGREGFVLAGLATLPLSRADGIVLGALLMLWHAREDFIDTRSWDRKVVGRRALALGIAALGVVAIRYAYYGHTAPNTYYLKMYSWSDRLLTGISEYGVRGLYFYGPAALLILVTSSLDEGGPRARRMLVPIVCIWLYGIWVGGDAFWHMRFVAPVVPMLWIAFGIAADRCWRRLPAPARAASAGALCLIAPLQCERGLLGASYDRSSLIGESVMTAKTFTKNVPEDGLIGIFSAGMIPYFAPDRRFLDLLGKNDAHIAHQARVVGSLPGHNKFDFAYAYTERRPDVTFAAHTCDLIDDFMKRTQESQLAFIHALPRTEYVAPWYQLLDPTFRAEYLPNRIVLREGETPVGHALGCWFRRADAPVAEEWQVVRY